METRTKNENHILEFIAKIKKDIPDELEAIYSVGINDSSILADYDLILVLKKKSKKIEKLIKKNSSELIDIRGVYSIDEWIQEAPYLLYANMNCIFGEPIKFSLQNYDNEKMGIIKIASLFFTSFLRNFYKLKFNKTADPAEILKNLNDFAYVPIWLNNPPKEIIDFLEKIKTARLKYPQIDKKEIEDLLTQAIDYSWKLVDLLNFKLKELFQIGYAPNIFYGTNPTIFIPASVEQCRILSEKRFKKFWRFKLLYLPLGFQFIFSGDKVVYKIFKNTQKPTYNLKEFFVRLAKKPIILFFYLIYFINDIYDYYCSKEVYSTKQAINTYKRDFYLLEAEKQAISFINLPKEAKILDVGCGTGRTTFSLINQGYKNIIGIDFEENLIKIAQMYNIEHTNKFLVLDVINLGSKFEEGSFDLVLFSYNGLDYLYPESQRKKGLQEIARILRKGGYFVFSSHNNWCINRKYISIYFKNLLNIIRNKKFYIVKQSFGPLLTYFSNPRSIIKEMNYYNLKHIKTIPNIKKLFPFRDPFPYYIFIKK